MSYQVTVTVVQDTTKSDSWRTDAYTNMWYEADDWVRKVTDRRKPIVQLSIVVTPVTEEGEA